PLIHSFPTRRSSDLSSTGLGDVAARLKVNVAQTKHVGVAMLLDARFPSGNADNLLGAGAFAGRGIGVVSATWGNTTPHLNLGYRSEEHTSELQSRFD